MIMANLSKVFSTYILLSCFVGSPSIFANQVIKSVDKNSEAKSEMIVKDNKIENDTGAEKNSEEVEKNEDQTNSGERNTESTSSDKSEVLNSKKSETIDNQTEKTSISLLDIDPAMFSAKLGEYKDVLSEYINFASLSASYLRSKSPNSAALVDALEKSKFEVTMKKDDAGILHGTLNIYPEDLKSENQSENRILDLEINPNFVMHFNLVQNK